MRNRNAKRTVESHGVGRAAWMVAMRKLPCHYCWEAPGGTIDHIKPTSKGGQSVPENCVPSCGPCNSWRKSRPYEWFKQWGWKQRQFAVSFSAAMRKCGRCGGEIVGGGGGGGPDTPYRSYSICDMGHKVEIS